LGTAVARSFLRDGWMVEGWTRSGTIEEEGPAGLHVCAVDVGQTDAVQNAGGEFDLVIHCASTRGGEASDYARLYREGLRNLQQRFGRSQIVLVSSTSVYAQKNGEWVNEESPAEPLHERGRILREAEELALAGGGRVARLAGLYGPGRSALLRRVQESEASIDEDDDRFVNQIHRDDAASALRAIARSVTPGSQVWNVADDRPFLLSECYRWLGHKLGRPLATTAPATAPRKRGESNKRVSNSRLRKLGWAPRYPSFEEGMEKSVLPLLRA
jgi:nucleoside-diphosphate-sugar epimerase